MKALIIDTTLKGSYVAAFDGEKETVSFLDAELSTQSALIPACKKALSALELAPNDLDAIGAVVGPGSFTGIRIGVSFANAFAFALSLPRFSLTSFDVMRALRPRATAYAVDAGREECYAALAEKGSLSPVNLKKCDLPEGAVDQSDLLSELPKGALLAMRKGLEEKAFSSCAPTSETTYFKPNYMKKSQAERLKDEKK